MPPPGCLFEPIIASCWAMLGAHSLCLAFANHTRPEGYRRSHGAMAQTAPPGSEIKTPRTSLASRQM